MRHLVYMWHILINLMNFTVNLYANLQLHYTATPLLMTIPLTNSRSYDQSFLKSILIKMSLKFHFKLHFALCARSVDYHNACQWDNRKTTESESPSTCWRVYIPPHFVFPTYDQEFRTYPVHKSGSACSNFLFFIKLNCNLNLK